MARVRTAVVLAALLAVTGGTAAAQQPPAAGGAAPDAEQLLVRMKAALEPPLTRASTLDIVLIAPQVEMRTWRALHAQQHRPEGSRQVLVLLQPPELAGVALMIEARPDGPDVQWDYLPTVQRVRQVYPVGGYEPFLGTDFTLSDLGFIDLDRRRARLLGTDTLDGVPVYKVEEIPEQRWYYGRTVSWIDQQTFLPLRREHFTPAGEPWRTQHFEAVREIDGVPTVTRIRMVDQRTGGTTELRFSDVRYGPEITPAVFDPKQMPFLREHLQPLVQAAGGGASPAGYAPPTGHSATEPVRR